jgi:predicted flap endonuclease-1-like 5' DNA nuclease/regulator of replication initiation timing
MPEITVIHIALLATALIIGVVVGWVFRGNKSSSEKAAINLGWQEQLEELRQEHVRLLDQNKSLMEQNSQYQASNTDSKMRASELSGALKEAFERRDELQRQIKDIRSHLESTVEERDQLASEMQNRSSDEGTSSNLLQIRDEQIETLSKELEGWQARVPPLVERYRTRNAEAEQLQQDLTDARAHIDALEAMVGSDETRVEPVDPEALGDTLDASNDPDDERADPAEDFEYVAEVEEVAELEEEAFVEEMNGVDASQQRDNLKKIKGVGPAIEKTLNEMGIVRFQQIADMSEYDIDRVAQRLKGFRSRIYREDWIGQARDYLNQNMSGSA